MAEVTLEPALEGDAVLLAEISKQAFHSDAQCGGSGQGGPPGYDSAEWQKAAIKGATAYLKILADGRLVGGIIAFDEGYGRYCLGRIFIAPSCQRQGIGLRAAELLCECFPDAKTWWLDTPAWNTRTRRFYEKLGFTLVEEREGTLVFERAMPAP